MKKQLAFKYDLDCKVSVYVPSTMDVNKPVDNTEKVLEIIKKLSTIFGGATASNAFGGWVAQNGEVVTEKVTIVYAFCSSEQLSENIDTVYGICLDLKKSMKQEAITLEINGQVKFISQKYENLHTFR